MLKIFLKCSVFIYFYFLNQYFSIQKMKFFLITICVSLLSLASCTSTNIAITSKKLYNKQLRSYVKSIKNRNPRAIDSTFINFVPTANFNLRKPNFIIIHHTAQDSLAQTIKTFQQQKTQVSAHYTIADNGNVVQMLNDYMRAWHAGAGKWGKNTDINSASIGIELDNNGTEPFSEAQIKSLLKLLTALKKEYNIPTANFIGHSDIAPSRKIDPSTLFPWKTLSEQGFGLWQNDELPLVPIDFNIEQGLKIIGYDTSNLSAAIIAFKRHFIQTDVTNTVDETTKAILYSIYLKQ